MTTRRTIEIYAGQLFQLSLPAVGIVESGNGLRMHLRSSAGASAVIAILTHDGADNLRAAFGTDTIDLTIGASVSAAWIVGDRRVEWYYDLVRYSLSDADNATIHYAGAAVVYPLATRPSDVTPVPGYPSGDGRYLRVDGAQALTTEQQEQAQINLLGEVYTPGGGATGDVVGPASATDSHLAAFDGATGKLLKGSGYTVAGLLSAARDRATHTGTQLAATISDFASAVGALLTWSAISGKPSTFTPSAHASSHATGGGDALTAADIGAAAASHTHTIGAWAVSLGSDATGDVYYRSSGGVLTRLGIGSAGQVLTVSGGLPAWAAAAGGVTGWTGAESTTSPNATVPAASLKPSNSATNVDAALAPKGTGALLAAVPDSLSSGGNKRGQYAVDFQMLRGAASHVASGQYAAILSGYYNIAAGLGAVVAGGYNNSASGQFAFAAGASNIASGEYSTAIGGANSATGSNSTALGSQNTVSGNHSTAFGLANTASGAASVAWGYQATTRGLQGARAYSSAARASVGDAQAIGQPVRRTTTDATTTTLTADGGTVAAYNVLVLPNNSSVPGLLWISARDTSGNCAAWLYFCCVKRGANAASTTVDFQTLVASNVTGALSTATAVIAADTTQGALVISVTGVAATTIDWLSDPSGLQIVR